MNNVNELAVQLASQSQTEVYEAPAIESVVTSEELEREVFYAGIVVGTPAPAA